MSVFFIFWPLLLTQHLTPLCHSELAHLRKFSEVLLYKMTFVILIVMRPVSPISPLEKGENAMVWQWWEGCFMRPRLKLCVEPNSF